MKKDPFSFRKVTQTITDLNEKRVELELTKEQIRIKSEEKKEVQNQLTVSKQELRDTNLEIDRRRLELHNLEDVSKQVILKRKELSGLDEKISIKLKDSLVKEKAQQKEFNKERLKKETEKKDSLSQLDTAIESKRDIIRTLNNEISEKEKTKAEILKDLDALKVEVIKEYDNQTKERKRLEQGFAWVENEKRRLKDTETLIKALIN